MIRSIINLVYPASCLVCGTKTKHWNQNICEVCLKKIKKRLPPFCIKCGKQIHGEAHLQKMCRDCKDDAPYFDRANSIFYYDGILIDLIHKFKYKKMTSLVKEFAEFMVDSMDKYDGAKGFDLILSIPMHHKRLFKREINTSLILAKFLAKKLGIQYSGRLLKKTNHTPMQSKLPRQRRIANIKGSFSLDKNKKNSLKQKRILIVDDIFTTGSTVNECARLLKAAGSGYVEVITLARGDVGNEYYKFVTNPH